MKVKKILIVFLIFAIVFAICSVKPVYASSFSVNMTPNKQNYAPGQTVVITVSLADIDLSSSRGIYGLGGIIDYDTNIFEPMSTDEDGNITDESVSRMDGINDWGSPTLNASTYHFSILTTKSVKENKNIMTISLKVKQNAQLGKSVIMLRELQASDGENDIVTSPVTASVNITESAGDDIPVIQPTPTPTPTPTPVTKPTTVTTQVPTTKTSAPTSVVTATPTSGSNLPQTGIENMAPLFIGALILCLVSYIAYNRYKGI